MKEINHECYVSLEVAKLLEKAGFDWESHFTCKQQQDEWQQFASIEVSNPHYDKSIPFSSQTNIVVLPHVTLDVAQRWLREEKGFNINICWLPGSLYGIEHFVWNAYSACDFLRGGKPMYDVLSYEDNIKYCTYEEAQEAGIKKALKIILEKGE